jgi:hypothetical protein
VDQAATRAIAFVDRHETAFVKAGAAIVVLMMAALWSVMAPGLAKGADRTHFYGWLWVFTYFGVLAGLIWHRLRDHTGFGRRLMYFHHLLLFVGWQVSQYEMGRPCFFVDRAVESIFYATVTTCAQWGFPLIGLFYFQREVARRRRVKTAYGVEDVADE